jgi:hypothetical protein
MSSGFTDLNIIKTKITSVKDEKDTKYIASFLSKKDSQRAAFDLAVDHALDIVNSLEGRFITGQSDSVPRGYDSIDVYFQDDRLF